MYRLPSGALWMLVFTAVLGHLPGLAFDLARHDFEGLARAAGLDPSGAWSPRAWTDFAVWSIWWRIGGTDPAAPHGFSVLLVALNALLISAFVPATPVVGPITMQGLTLMGLYLLGAVNPSTGESSALLAPTVNTAYMNHYPHPRFASESIAANGLASVLNTNGNSSAWQAPSRPPKTGVRQSKRYIHTSGW